MKYNVLVFPCGSEIGLEVFRAVSSSTHFNLIGASSVDDHGMYVYQDYIGGLPGVNDDAFVEKLNTIINNRKIDFVIPAHDSVVLRLSEAVASGDLSCALITSPYETCKIARSKRKTYDFLRDKVDVPRIYSLNDVMAQPNNIFPLFLKPDVGQGSKGTHKAQTIEDVKFYLSTDPTLLILEYLPGVEYTIDCFTNSAGKLLYKCARIRARTSNGISVSSTFIDNELLEEMAVIINDNIKFIGAWFFQVKENRDGSFVLMEIAPRIAGTMGLSRCKGVNLVLLSLYDALGKNVSVLRNDYQLTIDRALENRYKHDIQYEHLYVDLDDFIIINNRVSLQVIRLLYQCLNKNISIHLLTRHKGNLKDTLTKYRISNLFDTITHVQAGEPKSRYIAHSNAIFLDDSYVERVEVYNEHKIPVFDSHMIEALIESN